MKSTRKPASKARSIAREHDTRSRPLATRDELYARLYVAALSGYAASAGPEEHVASIALQAQDLADFALSEIELKGTPAFIPAAVHRRERRVRAKPLRLAA